MRQAFDAIVNVLAGGDFDNPLCDLKQAALALQQAIAKAEKSVHASDTSSERVNKTEKNEHEWVGLTDEEKGWCAAPTYKETIERVEAKLKEKNT
jgi:hypothetical protein